jgi:hypothetical protein
VAPGVSLAQRGRASSGRSALDSLRRIDSALAASHKVTFGTIDGVVTDTSLVPVANANVTVLSSSVRVETGSNGRFRLIRVPAGQYLLIVRRLGFHPLSGVVQVAANDTLRLSYQLEPAPQTLGPVVITEERRSFRMMEFEYRRKLGIGEFMSADEIDKRGSAQATDILRTFPAIAVPDQSTGHGGTNDHYAMSRRGATSFAGSCVMAILVDGVAMPTPFNLDLLPPARDLAGIEVFAGPAEIPLEYALYAGTCGLVLVWTKDGS